MVASENVSWRNVSVEWFCSICCNVSTKQPGSHFAFQTFRFDAIQFIVFSEVLIEDSNGRWDKNSFVLSFFGFSVEAVVEVDESFDREPQEEGRERERRVGREESRSERKRVSKRQKSKQLY